MRRLLIMAAALVWATCARADSLSSAIMALSGADRASDRCDVSSADKLLHEKYHGTLITKNPASEKNDMLRVDKDGTLDILDYCARKLPYRSVTTRTLQKAELVSPGRVIVNGEFMQEAIEVLGKSRSVASGSFITALSCSELHECKVLTDTVFVKEISSRADGTK